MARSANRARRRHARPLLARSLGADVTCRIGRCLHTHSHTRALCTPDAHTRARAHHSRARYACPRAASAARRDASAAAAPCAAAQPAPRATVISLVDRSPPLSTAI